MSLLGDNENLLKAPSSTSMIKDFKHLAGSTNGFFVGVSNDQYGEMYHISNLNS